MPGRNMTLWDKVASDCPSRTNFNNRCKIKPIQYIKQMNGHLLYGKCNQDTCPVYFWVTASIQRG